MGVNKKLDGSPESGKEISPYVEIYEYKVLEGIRAELSELGFRSNVVGSPNKGWGDDGPVPVDLVDGVLRDTPQFVLQVWADVQWRVWLYDGDICVRDVGDDIMMKTKNFDLTDPNSISQLFKFMGVHDG